MHHAALTLPAEPRSPHVARRFVSEMLTEWGADVFTWDATVIVSELATNAVLHARTGFTVTLSLRDDVLRVEVADGSPQLPMLRDDGRHATTGRGLALLDILSREHGVHATLDGKTVWCELVPKVPGQRSPGVQDDDQLPGPSIARTPPSGSRHDRSEFENQIAGGGPTPDLQGGGVSDGT